MKINNLKLRGFIGIKKGLGLDEIDLDLSGLSGLIALSGNNGSSKTTILESLQPYRTLASRKKALSYHVYTRNATKELGFNYLGNNYETKILIDCHSGKQEGYLWKNGESMVDGKARNYDAYIENLFGSKDLFFNSIFCAQNASKLSDLTTGKLKELFAEFLRLDQYIAYEATTKQCISLLGTQAGTYQREAEKLCSILNAMSGLDEDLENKRVELSIETEGLNKIRGTIQTMESDIIKAKETIAANKALSDRAEDFKKRIIVTHEAIETESEAYEEKVSGLRAGVTTAKNTIFNLNQILEHKDRIEQALARRFVLVEKIETETESINVQTQGISKITGLIRDVEDTIRKEIIPHPDEANIPLLKEQIRNFEAQTADLVKRDPECASSICAFIKTALEAERSLPELEKQLAETVKAINEHDRKNAELRIKLETEKTALQGKEKESSENITKLQKLLTNHKKEHVELSPLADQAGDLREAMARKEAAEKRKEELTAQGMALKAEYDKRIESFQAELSSLKEKISEVEKQIDYEAQKTLPVLEQDVYHQHNEKKEIDRRITDLTATISKIEGSLAQKAVYEKQLTEAEDRGKGIQAQTSEWIYLRNALSKDGIRALEIDSVAPSISAYANQILFNTFGPAYSVKLRTQDDEGREVLDILALEESGRETLLEDLSGGEKVWSLKALRLAMTLIAKQKSGREFLSALADEEDGALDAENAQNFIHLYRSFMDAGGFEDCYFISHRPECVAMADHVLEFGKGGISVN